MPAAFPKVADVVPKVLEWCDAAVTGRVHFYSAREEQERTPPPKRAAPKKITHAALVEQLTALSAQVKLLSDQQQQMMQAKSSSSADRVPDPVLGGTMAARLPSLAAGLGASCSSFGSSSACSSNRTSWSSGSCESRRTSPFEFGSGSGGPHGSGHCKSLTALVAHLTGGTDALHDLSGRGASTLPMSGRGVAGREKMQQELAARSSGFFLQVQQQLYKRRRPSRQVPKTRTEVTASGVSMTAYLERYGGYRHARDAGLALWVAAHATTLRVYQRVFGSSCGGPRTECPRRIMEFGVGLDFDGRSSCLADRMTPVVSHGRPLSPLIPPNWAATSLANLKEIELLVTRKGDRSLGSLQNRQLQSQTRRPAPPPKEE